MTEKEKLKQVYRDVTTLYNMVKDECEAIRNHQSMRYASRAVRELDVGDAIIRRTLDEGNLDDMLSDFLDATEQIKNCMNKQYRTNFFRSSRDRRTPGSSGRERDEGRSRRDRDSRERRDRDGDRDRDRGRDRDDGGRDRDRDRGDRDRGGRDRDRDRDSGRDRDKDRGGRDRDRDRDSGRDKDRDRDRDSGRDRDRYR